MEERIVAGCVCEDGAKGVESRQVVFYLPELLLGRGES